MENQLQKAMNLARRTGDRLIVFDSQRPDSAFVVMAMDEYEKIVDSDTEVRNLTENELLDRINRDIALWKNEQYLKEQKARKDKDFFVDEDKKPNYNEENQVKNDYSQEADYLGITPDFFMKTDEKPAEERKEKGKKQWQIPVDRKQAAEEVIEEDRQYLEEIPY